MDQLYTIRDICMFTGLTDRTLRTHIAQGSLSGTKVDGAWRFTAEQVKTFLSLPHVWPGIQAKKNAIVLDFLRSKSAGTPKMCVVWDFPGEDSQEISTAFCRLLSETTDPKEELTFSADSTGTCPRIILRGASHDVLSLLNAFNCE